MVKRTAIAKTSLRQKRSAKPVHAPHFRARYAIVFVVLMILGGTIVLLSKAASSSYSWNASNGQVSGRMFSADAPINQPIPGDVRYQADGQTRLQAAGLPGILSLLEWAVPVFDVDGSAPKANVFCYVYACDAITNTMVPVPNGIFAQTGGDHHVVVIDDSTRKMYDYWIWGDCSIRFNLVNANWCPASGVASSIDGNGVGVTTNVAGIPGMIRTYEIEQGLIDHALPFSTATTCKGTPYYPAWSSDGTNTNTATCVPIGTRWQLDPSINVDAIPGITAYEKIIAKALQKYGMYACDTSSAFGFLVELDRTGRSVYQRAGAPSGDYFPLAKIPWTSMKLLQPQWNTDGSKAYSWGNAPAPIQAQIPVAIPATPLKSSGAATKPSPPSSTATGGSSSGSQSNPSTDTQPATLSPSPSTPAYSLSTGGPSAAKMTASSVRIVTSFAFINRSEITLTKVDGAASYRIRINNGVAQTTAKTTYSFWHFGSFAQDIHIQPIDAEGKNIANEEQFRMSPHCAWYGVCR